jgi:GNAT superfamily N-acetyltransferase
MSLTYSRGNIEDSYAVFQIFVRTIMDYSERMNVMAITGGNDPQVIESLWQQRKSMFEYLAESAAQFWVAENGGEIIAYARSTEHDGMQELTELFVSPHQQSSGVGRELLSRAFPKSEARYRTIIATLDERALYRYMKLGVYGRSRLNIFIARLKKWKWRLI